MMDILLQYVVRWTAAAWAAGAATVAWADRCCCTLHQVTPTSVAANSIKVTDPSAAAEKKTPLNEVPVKKHILELTIKVQRIFSLKKQPT